MFCYAAFLRGTFAPERRASDKPIAIACLRLFTFLPLRPLFSLPRLNSCISRFTDFPAFGLYLRREDFFALLRRELFFAEELRVLLRFAAVLRERDLLLRVEPLRDERLRVDFLVAAM